MWCVRVCVCMRSTFGHQSSAPFRLPSNVGGRLPMAADRRVRVSDYSEMWLICLEQMSFQLRLDFHVGLSVHSFF